MYLTKIRFVLYYVFLNTMFKMYLYIQNSLKPAMLKKTQNRLFFKLKDLFSKPIDQINYEINVFKTSVGCVSSLL